MLQLVALRHRVFERRPWAAVFCAAWLYLVGYAASADTIDTSRSYYLSSNLGSSASIDFRGGTLRVDSATTIAKDFTLADVSGSTLDAYGHAVTLSGVFSGDSGNITFADSAGGGAVTLTGTSTYTGTTTITGLLAFSGTGSIATSGAVTDNGVLDISRTSAGATITSLSGSGTVVMGIQNLTLFNSASTLLTGVISGSGKLTVAGGAQILSGDNSYSGGTTISSGTLQLGYGGTTGSVLGNVLSNGTLAFDRIDAVTFSNVVSGAGGLSQVGSGILTLTGANTFTGTTTISAGTLVLSGSGSLSTASSVYDNSVFDISGLSTGVSIRSLTGSGSLVLGTQSLTVNNSAGTFSGVISGTGGLVVTGGTQVLSGANTYTGGTTVGVGGTLQLGSASTGGSIIGDIADSGTVALNFSSGSYAGVISGTGGVVQAGTGTAYLTGVNTYTGLTIVNAGQLTLYGSGSIAASSEVNVRGTFDISALTAGTSIKSLSGSGKVSLGGQTLTLTNATSAFSGVISGTGGVVINAGSQTFSGGNGYTGTTTITGATLALSGSGSVGQSKIIDNGVFDVSALGTSTTSIMSLAGSGRVVLGTSVLLLSSASDIFSGAISGDGGLTLYGGRETLTGGNTYQGVTSISSGTTLALQGSGDISASSSVVAGGTFDLSAMTAGVSLKSLAGSGTVLLGSQTLTLSAATSMFLGVISGAGGVAITGGTQILSGTNTYTGGTTISTGTLQLGSGATTGTIVGDVIDNGTLAFGYSKGTFSGTITGSGNVNQSGDGITTLTATNTYKGGTTITAGTLQLGNGGTTGSIIGNVADNGTLAFNRSDGTIFSGVISGSGGINQVGTGTTTLIATNTYTGETSIAAGSLILLANGSIAASSGVVDNGLFDISGMTTTVSTGALSGTGTVHLGSQTLTLTSGTGSFSGTISGSGGLTLRGGTQTVSGTNTYTGTTSVAGGTLTVDDSITSSNGVTVASGGTVRGVGTLSPTTVKSGGTLAPGDGTAGTLHVAGTVMFESGSNYMVSSTSAATSELIVSNAATLGGTLTVETGAGYPLGQKRTIITASSLTGSFTLGATSSANGALGYKLSQDATAVYLEIDLAKLTPLLPSASSINDRNLSAGIDAAIAKGDKMSSAFQSIGNLSGADLTAALDQLSGQVGSDLPGVGRTAFDAFVDNLFDHIDDLGGGRHKPIANEVRNSSNRVWGALFTGNQALRGAEPTQGSVEADTNISGIVGGIDWRLSPAMLLGAAISVTQARLRVGGDLGTGQDNAFLVGGYGFFLFSPHTYGTLALGGAIHSLKSTRLLSVSGNDTLAAGVNAYTLGGRYETGTYFRWATPYVAVQLQSFFAPAYGEKATAGSSTFALEYAAQNAHAARVELGLGEVGSVALWGGRLDLASRLAWGYDFESAPITQRAFLALSGSDFTIQGVGSAPNKLLLSLGAGYTSESGLGFHAKFDSASAGHSQTVVGSAGLNFTW